MSLHLECDICKQSVRDAGELEECSSSTCIKFACGECGMRDGGDFKFYCSEKCKNNGQKRGSGDQRSGLKFALNVNYKCGGSCGQSVEDCGALSTCDRSECMKEVCYNCRVTGMDSSMHYCSEECKREHES
jgi:hypothetical protein